jgi:hypothetical protein
MNRDSKNKTHNEILDAMSEIIDKKNKKKEKAKNFTREVMIHSCKEYFEEVESLVANKVDTYQLLANCFNRLKVKLRSLDSGINVVCYWKNDESEKTFLSHIKLIWSDAYAKANGLDKELIVDSFDCLLAGALHE